MSIRVHLHTCRWNIFSSMVPAVASLYTWTLRRCPSLQTLAMACTSVAGFQSMSKRRILDAPIRLRPVPPALELNNKTKAWLLWGELKF